MGSPAQPLLNLRSRLGRASREFLDAHPIDALTTLMGSEPEPTPAPANNGYLDQQVRAANQSFRDAANRQNPPQQVARRRMPDAVR